MFWMIEGVGTVIQQRLSKIPLKFVGIVVLFAFAISLIFYHSLTSNQAINAIAAQIRFEGEYRIKDGQWKEIVAGQHISSTKGDVTLRGNFHLYFDEEYLGVFTGDVPIALYTNHINVTIIENDSTFKLDHEDRMYGLSECGVYWTAHDFIHDGSEPIEIVIHNPHRFGNEIAVDELLSNFAIWGTLDFEKSVLSQGSMQRNMGLVFIIVGFALLGTSLFCLLLHVPNGEIISLLGFAIIFAGSYFTYSAIGVSIWSDSVVFNTTFLGITMMFYMFFILNIFTYYFNHTKKVASLITSLVGIMNCICLILPILSGLYFYDLLEYWAIGQTIANVVIAGCATKEYFSSKNKKHNIYVGMIILLLTFELDLIATHLGFWSGGYLSKYTFFGLFGITLIVVLMVIPNSINEASKAKELEMQRSRLEAEKNRIEMELKENRISLMLSQIRPHFIYNTLGTIERMCLKDPQKAFELVRNFSLYLRGNFSELDSVIPIRFSQEIKHVEYYVNIEKVRFPDINIEYHIETSDFDLPALSVQPLVENAIKHGLMGLETGGTVVIRSYETSEYYYVEVSDNGIGFDVNVNIEDKKHVGLRNIRERLHAMVDGHLTIESEINKGTKAIIMIPKE